MIDDLSKLLKQVSGPADMAVILLAGTAGFVVDAGLNVVGFLSPGVVGVTAATGALGVKRSYDAWRQRRRNLRAVTDKPDDVLHRAQRLLGWLEEHGGATPVTDRLNQELDLYTEGVTTSDDLQHALEAAIEAIRQAGPKTAALPRSGGVRRRAGAGIRSTLDP